MAFLLLVWAILFLTGCWRCYAQLKSSNKNKLRKR
uniref:Uncharacterized protein n=1 Tax=Anguilla anguilla TaxID=7936 RepID=A0A0E9PGM7_ANGAN